MTLSDGGRWVNPGALKQPSGDEAHKLCTCWPTCGGSCWAADGKGVAGGGAQSAPSPGEEAVGERTLTPTSTLKNASERYCGSTGPL